MATHCKRPTMTYSVDSSHFFIYSHARITLTDNIWTKHGLVNGANGIILDFVYCDTRHKVIPINSITKFNTILNASRMHYPLRLTYALTIHESQFQTL